MGAAARVGAVERLPAAGSSGAGQEREGRADLATENDSRFCVTGSKAPSLQLWSGPPQYSCRSDGARDRRSTAPAHIP